MLCLHVNEDKILMLLPIGLMAQAESHLRKVVWNVFNQKNTKLNSSVIKVRM